MEGIVSMNRNVNFNKTRSKSGGRIRFYIILKLHAAKHRQEIPVGHFS